MSETDYSKYLIYSRSEIAHILNAVEQKRELVTAHYGKGRQFLLTSILEVRAEDIVFDYGKDRQAVEKLLAASRVVFVTSLERVKIQFSVTDIRETTWEDEPALVAKLPDSLLKLQRREFFRVTTSVTQPLVCRVRLPTGRLISFNILDISLGGLGLVGTNPEFDTTPGTHYPECMVELPEFGSLSCELEIRNSFDVTLRNGQIAHRTGCQFLNLSTSMQTMLQRFILKLERDRLARLGNT